LLEKLGETQPFDMPDNIHQQMYKFILVTKACDVITSTKRNFRSQLMDAWEKLPPLLKQKYPKNEGDLREYLSIVTKAKRSAGQRRRYAEHPEQMERFRAASSAARRADPRLNEKMKELSQAASLDRLSAATRAKLSAGSMGKRHSTETRAKMSEARTGIRKSEETKARISATKRAQAAAKRALSSQGDRIDSQSVAPITLYESA
jgi:hypothetical protein